MKINIQPSHHDRKKTLLYLFLEQFIQVPLSAETSFQVCSCSFDSLNQNVLIRLPMGYTSLILVCGSHFITLQDVQFSGDSDLAFRQFILTFWVP